MFVASMVLAATSRHATTSMPALMASIISLVCLLITLFCNRRAARAMNRNTSSLKVI